MLSYYNKVKNINRLIEHIKVKGFVINGLIVKTNGNYKNSGFLFDLLKHIKENFEQYCLNADYSLEFWQMFLNAINAVINEAPPDEGEVQASFVLKDETVLSIQSLLTEFERCYEKTGGNKKVWRKTSKRKDHGRKDHGRKITRRETYRRKITRRKDHGRKE